MFPGLRLRILPPVVLLVCTLAPPVSASAAGSPLHVDPRSPVAKAYALPLGTARGTASAGGRGSELFGSGIDSAASTGPGARPGRVRTSPINQATVTYPTLAVRPSVRRLRGRATPAAYRVLEPGSGAGVLWMALAAAVVIACGGAAALALRRKR